MDIQPGDVIFYRPEGFIGTIISKLTRSEYSHVSLAVDATTIIEANRFIKSRVVDLNYADDIHRVYRLRNISPGQQEFIVENALTMVGARYDYAQIFGLWLRLVFSIESKIFNKVNKYICSEIIDKAFILSMVPRKDNLIIGEVSPQELLEKYDLVKVE